MPTSRTTYSTVPTRRDTAGQGDQLSDCKTVAYDKDAQGNKVTFNTGKASYFPAGKRYCVRTILNLSDSDTFGAGGRGDKTKLSAWFANNVGQGDAQSEFNGLIDSYIGKTISSISESDPVYDTSDPPKRTPSEGFDFFKFMGDTLTFLGNPATWAAIIALPLGLIILGFGMYKGLTSV
jgi:hypothetical protein